MKKFITVGDLYLEEVAMDVLLNTMASNKPVYKPLYKINKPNPNPVKKPKSGFSDRFKELMKFPAKKNYLKATPVEPVMVNTIEEVIDSEPKVEEPKEVTTIDKPVVEEVSAPKCVIKPIIKRPVIESKEEQKATTNEVKPKLIKKPKIKKPIKKSVIESIPVELEVAMDIESECISNKEESAPISELTTPTRLDTLLDIIIENQEEFKANLHCPSCHKLWGIGLRTDDLTDKPLARGLYIDILFAIKKSFEFEKYINYESFTRDDLLDILIQANNSINPYMEIPIVLCGIEDDISALNRAIA